MSITTNISLRYLKQNKKRTAITIIGVILATLLLTCVITMFTSLQNSIINYAKSQNGNWHAEFMKVPYQNASEIIDSKDVRTSMLSRDIGFSLLKNQKNSYRPYLYLAAYDQNMFNNYPLTLVSGRLPQNEGEVAITSQLGTDEHYQVGQQISLNLGQRTLTDGSFVQSSFPITGKETLTHTKTMTFTIVGVINQPDFTPGLTPGLMAITFLNRQSLSPRDIVDISILIKDPAQIYTVAPKMADSAHIESDLTHLDYNQNLLDFMGIGPNKAFQLVMLTVFVIILLIIIVCAVTLMYNSFTISVSERSQQFGILSSVGGTQKQMQHVVLFEGFVISLIAIPIGLILGLGGLGGLLTLAKPLLGSMFTRGYGIMNVSLFIKPGFIILVVVLAIFTVFISALIPTWKIRKISAMDAIRKSKEIEIKEKKLKISPLIKKIFGIEGYLAMKNFKRNRKRYRTIIFSLFMSIILFISISAATLYMSTSVRLAEDSMNYNIGIGFIDMDSSISKFINVLGSMDTVQDYSVLRKFRTEAGFDTSNIANVLANTDGFSANSQRVYIYSLGDTKFKSILNKIGVDLNKYLDTSSPAGVLINQGVFRTDLSRHIETNVFSKVPGSITINGDKASTKVSVKNTIDYSPTGISKVLDTGLHIIVSDEVYDAIQSQVLKGFKPVTQVFIMSSNVSDTLRSINQSIKDLNVNVSYVEDVDSSMNRQRNIMLLIQILAFGFISLVTLIGISNVFNTISTGVALRRKELAMLKSVGMTPKAFTKMVYFESFFYGFKALFYSLPVGIILSVLLYLVFIRQFVFKFTLPWISIIICVVGVFAIVFGTMLYSNRKISRENIVEVLRSDIS